MMILLSLLQVEAESFNLWLVKLTLLQYFLLQTQLITSLPFIFRERASVEMQRRQ